MTVFEDAAESDRHAAAHDPHAHHNHADGRAAASTSLDRMAVTATLHCLTGCAIGEVAGMAIGSALGWSMWETVALAVTLAFITGFAMTMRPLIAGGMPIRRALAVAFAADFFSVTVMEIVDNAVMIAIPGAIHAGPGDLWFWTSMAFALAVAGLAAFPVNRWLIARGKGHAVVHAHHAH
jgi:hypothetical protein